MGLLDECVDHCLSVFAFYSGDQYIASMTFNQGCDLLIILDVDVLEKVMIRPPYMDLKLPVSYVLVLFGSQVKNSARRSEN